MSDIEANKAVARRYMRAVEEGDVETIEAPSDYVVKPGDTVFVYERFF